VTSGVRAAPRARRGVARDDVAHRGLSASPTRASCCCVSWQVRKVWMVMTRTVGRPWAMAVSRAVLRPLRGGASGWCGALAGPYNAVAAPLAASDFARPAANPLRPGVLRRLARSPRAAFQPPRQCRLRWPSSDEARPSLHPMLARAAVVPPVVTAASARAVAEKCVRQLCQQTSRKWTAL